MAAGSRRLDDGVDLGADLFPGRIESDGVQVALYRYISAQLPARHGDVRPPVDPETVGADLGQLCSEAALQQMQTVAHDLDALAQAMMPIQEEARRGNVLMRQIQHNVIALKWKIFATNVLQEDPAAPGKEPNLEKGESPLVLVPKRLTNWPSASMKTLGRPWDARPSTHPRIRPSSAPGGGSRRASTAPR